MIQHLSFSQINLFTKCQMQYRFYYVDKIYVPVNGDLIRGDAYHKAMAYAYSCIAVYKETPTIDEVLAVYSDTWNKRIQGRITIDEGEEIYVPAVEFGDKDPGKMKDDGVVLLRKYYNTILPTIIPDEVEVRKTTVYEGIPLIAYIDLIDLEGTVIDHKVKARMFSESELAKDLQSSIYGLILGVDELNFHYHVALALKEPDIKIVPLKRNKTDMDWAGRLIVSTWKQIQEGLFSPCTAGWWCAPDQCGYWGHCHLPKWF